MISDSRTCCSKAIQSLSFDLRKIDRSLKDWLSAGLDFDLSKLSSACSGCRKLSVLHYFYLIRKIFQNASNASDLTETDIKKLVRHPLVLRKSILALDLSTSSFSLKQVLLQISEVCRQNIKPRPLDSHVLLYSVTKSDSSRLWIGIHEKRVAEILELPCLLDMLPDPENTLLIAELKISNYKLEQILFKLFDQDCLETASDQTATTKSTIQQETPPPLITNLKPIDLQSEILPNCSAKISSASSRTRSSTTGINRKADKSFELQKTNFSSSKCSLISEHVVKISTSNNNKSVGCKFRLKSQEKLKFGTAPVLPNAIKNPDKELPSLEVNQENSVSIDLSASERSRKSSGLSETSKSRFLRSADRSKAGRQRGLAEVSTSEITISQPTNFHRPSPYHNINSFPVMDLSRFSLNDDFPSLPFDSKSNTRDKPIFFVIKKRK